MKIVASLPLPVVDKQRMVMQKIDGSFKMAPIDWLPINAQPTVQHLLNEIDLLKDLNGIPREVSVMRSKQ